MRTTGRALAVSTAAAALAVGVLGACGHTVDLERYPVIVVFPDRQTPVVWYEVGGGFMPLSWSLMEGPRLVVYSDGRVVADNKYTLMLAREDAANLVLLLRLGLKRLGGVIDVGAGDQIADAPTTRIRVYIGEKLVQLVSAYALAETVAYPQPLHEARNRLEDLARRVRAEGAPYESDRIRIVLQPDAERGGTITTWPAGVALPPELHADQAGEGVRTADLAGQDALAVARSLPDTWRTAYPWPVVRAPDGTLYGVAWRYLLPDEKFRD
jgi:hypothetical protein